MFCFACRFAFFYCLLLCCLPCFSLPRGAQKSTRVNTLVSPIFPAPATPGSEGQYRRAKATDLRAKPKTSEIKPKTPQLKPKTSELKPKAQR